MYVCTTDKRGNCLPSAVMLLLFTDLCLKTLAYSDSIPLYNGPVTLACSNFNKPTSRKSTNKTTVGELLFYYLSL